MTGTSDDPVECAVEVHNNITKSSHSSFRRDCCRSLAFKKVDFGAMYAFDLGKALHIDYFLDTTFRLVAVCSLCLKCSRPFAQSWRSSFPSFDKFTDGHLPNCPGLDSADRRRLRASLREKSTEKGSDQWNERQTAYEHWNYTFHKQCVASACGGGCGKAWCAPSKMFVKLPKAPDVSDIDPSDFEARANITPEDVIVNPDLKPLSMNKLKARRKRHTKNCYIYFGVFQNKITTVPSTGRNDNYTEIPLLTDWVVENFTPLFL